MTISPYPDTDYDEPRRGQFHVSSRYGWMNDPNGLLHYHGTYHLFYQHNPHSLEWDTMHWGHLSSTDLVHWTQQPIALDPETHPGVLFSGGGIVDHRNTTGLATDRHDPILLFTGTDEVRAMVSTDGTETFTPFADGAVLVRPGGTESRDPKVFRHEASEQWVMVLWSDEDGNPSERRLVLVTASSTYLVGAFDGERFVPETTTPRTVLREAATGAGSDYWAAQTFCHVPDDRVVSIAWQGRNRGESWTGNLTLPVEQELRTVDGELRVHSVPVREIESLRTATTTRPATALEPTGLVLGPDPAAPGAAGLDLELVLEGTGGARVLLESVGSAGTVQTLLTYDAAAHTLDGITLPDVPEVRIRVLLDRDQLALFAADGLHYAAQNRCLEDPSPTAEIRLRADGGEARVTELNVHALGSAWGWARHGRAARR